jgi:hypothetical protein
MAESVQLYGHHEYDGITLDERLELIITYLQGAGDAFNIEEGQFLKEAAELEVGAEAGDELPL